MRPPDVNAGSFKFSVKAGEAIYGLGAIKGLGEGSIAQLVEARDADGPFTDLFDFCRRVGTGKVNRRALEALIRAGAFDSLNEQRWVVMSSLEDAVGQADQEARNEAVGMDDMFGLGDGALDCKQATIRISIIAQLRVGVSVMYCVVRKKRWVCI